MFSRVTQLCLSFCLTYLICSIVYWWHNYYYYLFIFGWSKTIRRPYTIEWWHATTRHFSIKRHFSIHYLVTDIILQKNFSNANIKTKRIQDNRHLYPCSWLNILLGTRKQTFSLQVKNTHIWRWPVSYNRNLSKKLYFEPLRVLT